MTFSRFTLIGAALVLAAIVATSEASALHARLGLSGRSNGNGNGNGDDNGDANGKAYGRLGREYEARLAKAERDKATLRALYNVTIFPHSMDLAAGAPLPDIFAPKFKIRLFPVGAYTDAQGALEYFVLAAPNPGKELSTQVRVPYVQFEELEATGDGFVSFSVIIPLVTPAFPARNINFTHFGHCHLDENSRICGCKMTFQRLDLTEPPLAETREEIIAQRIRPLCENIVNSGAQVPTLAAEDRYESVDACVAFQLEPARYRGGLGLGYTYVDQDSPKCRDWHMILVGQALARAANAAAVGDSAHHDYFLERARQHLTHAGPRGGGKCVDHPFASFELEDFRCQA